MNMVLIVKYTSYVLQMNFLILLYKESHVEMNQE